MAYAYKTYETKYNQSLMQNHMIKDEFVLYIEMLALDTTKLKWIWTKLYQKRINLIDQMFNLIDQRRNCF